MAAAKRGEICPQCGKLHEKCLAHMNGHPDWPCHFKVRNSKEGPTGFCRWHGGKEIAKRTRDRLVRNAKAIEFLHLMKMEPIGDPVAALEEAVAEARAVYEFYKSNVAQMTADKQRYESEKGIEQLRSEVTLMERWHDRYTLGLATLQKMKRQTDGSAGDTLLDIIKQGLDRS